MPNKNFTSQHKRIGRIASWIYVVLSVIYAITTLAGLMSLESSDDPIDDPCFTIMEILIILIAPALVIILATVYAYASNSRKFYGLLGLIFMTILACITSCVHFVILNVRNEFEATQVPGRELFLSFTWPSVVYALDILAWDFFFAISMIFAALVFKNGKTERCLKYLLLLSGILSFLGLLGIPFDNMNVRNIGVIGYAVVAPIAVVLFAVILGRMNVEIVKDEKQ